jgi:hypothetical protein
MEKNKISNKAKINLGEYLEPPNPMFHGKERRRSAAIVHGHAADQPIQRHLHKIEH